ncbi:MAG: aldo/keto reductase [Chloroflexi bacterium]|nr:aldo/keto reductase [Anaerolineaceae bacterium]NMB90017.1 aldo/keto reductase [Chloroflexota bacterium]
MEQTSEKRHPVLAGVPMGIGAWSWGDRLVWGYGREYADQDLEDAFQACLANGVQLIDTAESYGQGRSESLIGQFLQAGEQKVKIATKFMPYPWRLGHGSLIKALKASLARLDLPQVDLYQIHWPLPPLTVQTWMEAMLEALEAGLIKAVGVSNYNRSQMQVAYDTLIHQGVQLASNQVEYNLLNRRVEKNGTLRHCQELGITLVAYSPLAMGLLSGKYTPDNPPHGTRGGKYNRKYLQQIQPLLTELRRIGADHAGKTAAQVALNWVMRKGALPIPGAKNAEQVELNTGALGWSLSDEDMASLDKISDRVTAG